MPVIIQGFTTRNPISMIGKEAGVCWGANTDDAQKNFNRGMNCLKSGHGRTFEFPDVYMVLDGYSARVIREWYTHIGGSPTRLQESTRYINYQKGFDYVVPSSIGKSVVAKEIYEEAMESILEALQDLEEIGVPREDSALLLPLGMQTKIVCKHNLRNLIDMSHQRMCTRAYHEYRKLFADIMEELKKYSDEWGLVVDTFFKPKCEVCGFCSEEKSCGRMPKKDV